MNLLILPFDHRSSFSKKILGIEGKPNAEQKEKIEQLKYIIFQAFKKVREKDEKPEELGILVDEQYGSEILKEANTQGITTAAGVEKSGQKIFKFEYGRKFSKHIEKIRPNYVKVLVRYNPDNKKINAKQLKRLKRLSDFCEKSGNKLLFEILVPPTEEDKKSGKDYDTEIRPEKTRKSLEEIQEKVKVDIWKLEGFDNEGWKQVLQAFPEGKEVNIVVLGRGENPQKVNFWLNEAAKFDQIIGFAVGRTIFMEPLLQLLHKNIDSDEAEKRIAENYSAFITLWRDAKNKAIS